MSDKDIVKLNIMGISYNPVQRGAFVLLLAEDNGPYRIPIVIGASEAQSIAIKIEGIVPPRPITHDLFCSLMHGFGIELVDVFIYKFEDGIFSAELTFIDSNGNEMKLDSRTSDAIAVAIRTGAPIFTTRDIVEKTGTIFNDSDNDISDDKDISLPKEQKLTYDDLSVDDLQKLLAKLIAEENYEEASKVSEAIKRKNK